MNKLVLVVLTEGIAAGQGGELGKMAFSEACVVTDVVVN